MWNRGDRSFEQQFQWEVDRWVFRYHHRGDPIEVTREERNRLIGRHEARMLFCQRLFKLGILTIFALCFAFPREGEWIVVGAYGSIFVFVPLFSRWAYHDVTAHLRRRVPVGLRLDLVGRMTRNAQAQSWRRLLGGLAYLLVISAMMAAGNARDPFYALYLLLDGTIALFFAWMIIVKWAEETRERARAEKMEEVRRVRNLRS